MGDRPARAGVVRCESSILERGNLGVCVAGCAGGLGGVSGADPAGCEADRQTWKVWSLWLTSLYVLPLVRDHSVFGRAVEGWG